MKAGEVFTEEKVWSIRPGYGLHPRYLQEVLERRASRILNVAHAGERVDR